MKNNMANKQRLNTGSLRQRAFSLVELMVSLVVGLILIYGVSEIYVNSKVTYNVNEEMSRMQESARFSFDLMVPTVRQTGYTGCVSLNSKEPNDIRKGPKDDFTMATAITGHEATSSSAWMPSLPAGITAKGNTDVITVQSTTSCGAQLTSALASKGGKVHVSASNTCSFTPAESYMISDCKKSDLFKVTAVNSPSASVTTVSHGSDVNISPPHFQDLYLEDAEVLKPTSMSYYIGTGASTLPALYSRNNLSGTVSELVEGVESMQVLYGVDTDATADGVVDRYLKANAISTAVPPVIPGWDRVIAVRISLLMRSVGAAATASGSYTFDGVSYGADRFLRQEYTSTVQLRNRSLLP